MTCVYGNYHGVLPHYPQIRFVNRLKTDGETKLSELKYVSPPHFPVPLSEFSAKNLYLIPEDELFGSLDPQSLVNDIDFPVNVHFCIVLHSFYLNSNATAKLFDRSNYTAVDPCGSPEYIFSLTHNDTPTLYAQPEINQTVVPEICFLNESSASAVKIINQTGRIVRAQILELVFTQSYNEANE